MYELFHDYAAYWMCFLLMTLGLHGMIAKRNYLKKVIGMTIFQAAIILFFVTAGYKEGGSVPILDPDLGARNPDAYVSPLPHTLMLTAIVVGVASMGVAMSLLIRIHEGYGTLDEDTLRDRMKQ